MLKHLQIQKIAIKCQVPAWSTMLDSRPYCMSNERAIYACLLDTKGITFRVNTDDRDWVARFENACTQYALTDECKTEWARYTAENMPAIGTFAPGL